MECIRVPAVVPLVSSIDNCAALSAANAVCAIFLGFAPLALAAPVRGHQCFLDCSFHVILLPPLVPLVTEVAGPNCGLHFRLGTAMGKGVDGVREINPSSVAAVPRIAAKCIYRFRFPRRR